MAAAGRRRGRRLAAARAAADDSAHLDRKSRAQPLSPRRIDIKTAKPHTRGAANPAEKPGVGGSVESLGTHQR